MILPKKCDVLTVKTSVEDQNHALLEFAVLHATE